MARLEFEVQAVRDRDGDLATGVAYQVYSDEAATSLADISATSGGSAIAGSTVVVADIAGLGPSALRWWGPPAGTDELYLKTASDPTLPVQKVEAVTDQRLDALEAALGGTTPAQFARRDQANTFTADNTFNTDVFFKSGRPQVDARGFASVKAAVDAAPTAARIHLAPGSQASGGAILLRAGLTIEGDAALDGAGLGSIVTFSATDGFVFPPGGGNRSGIELNRLVVAGATRGLVALEQSSHVTVRNVHVDASGGTDGIYQEGQIEEWVLDHVHLQGGQYGYRHANVNYGGSNYIDKSTFKDVLTSGQSKYGWRLEATYYNTCTWLNPIINTPAEHGFYLNGGARGMVVINANDEGVGQSGKSNRTTLTGTVSSGATSGTLASATGWATGDQITIAGAAGGGEDLVDTVTISGTTATWSTPTSTTVVAPAVTNAKWDAWVFDSSIAIPTGVAFYGGAFGGEGSGGHIRYAAKFPTSGLFKMDAATNSAAVPVYDPGSRVRSSGGGQLVVRRPGYTCVEGEELWTPVVQPTVTGSRGGNAALASLLTELAKRGLIVNSSSA